MVAKDEGTGYSKDEHLWWLSHGGHQSTQRCLFPSAHHLCCIVHCILPLKELGNIVRVSDQWPYCNCPFNSSGQELVEQLYSAVNLWEASWEEQVKLALYIYIFFFFSETNQGCWGFFQSVEHWRSAAAFEGPSSNSLSETSPVHQMICVSVVCRWSDTMRQTRMLCPPSDWRHASLPAGRMSSWPNPWYGFLGMYHFLFTCCVCSDL